MLNWGYSGKTTSRVILSTAKREGGTGGAGVSTQCVWCQPQWLHHAANGGATGRTHPSSLMSFTASSVNGLQ